ncbi:MAG: histidine kinase [Bacteroidota bacterium]
MKVGISRNEVIFQIILLILTFLFYSFDKNEPQINEQHVVFFLNYVLAVFFINYFLLPRFFYRKNYITFFVLVAVTIGWVILIEELVLEKIYFPDTRGKSFPGLFYTLVQILPVIVILSGFKFAWDALIKQQEVETLKENMLESELQFLTSQINPHFLFNNLNNLYSYAIEQSPKTPTIILELSSVLRYMLYECKEKYVLLSKEIEQLQNFTRLSQLQIEDRGTVTFNSHLSDSHYYIAPLILIVFIENAFKHSQASQSSNIQIDINIDMEEDGWLRFFCANSYDKESNTDNLDKGIGLANVKKRLELLYPDTHNLEITDKNGLFEVALTLKMWQEKPVS